MSGVRESDVTDAVNDVLYEIARITQNDDEPSDHELQALREIIKSRWETRYARDLEGGN